MKEIEPLQRHARACRRHPRLPHPTVRRLPGRVGWEQQGSCRCRWPGQARTKARQNRATRLPTALVIVKETAHSQTCDRGPRITHKRVKGEPGTRTHPTDFSIGWPDIRKSVGHRLCLFFWEGSCRIHHIEQNTSALHEHPLKLNEKTLFTHGEG